MNRTHLIDSLLIRDLRAVTSLAEFRHFGNAADSLGLSQPSLSAIIRKVESTLGTVIFERSARKFVITPAGEPTLRQIRAVLEEADRLASSMNRQGPPLTGRYRLGIIPTIGPYYVPLFLRQLLDKYPQLELVFHEGKTADLLVMLRQRELDGALLALPIHSPELKQIPIFREPFVLAVPAGHPLTSKQNLTTADVNPNELLVLKPGNCLRDQTLDACGAAASADLRPIHAASLETLRHLIAAGRGIGLFPKLAATGIPDVGLSYLSFSDPQPGREIGLVYRENSLTAADSEALVQTLIELPRREVEDN